MFDYIITTFLNVFLTKLGISIIRSEGYVLRHAPCVNFSFKRLLLNNQKAKGTDIWHVAYRDVGLPRLLTLTFIQCHRGQIG